MRQLESQSEGEREAHALKKRGTQPALGDLVEGGLDWRGFPGVSQRERTGGTLMGGAVASEFLLGIIECSVLVRGSVYWELNALCWSVGRVRAV
jgi:hypothetical protein